MEKKVLYGWVLQAHEESWRWAWLHPNGTLWKWSTGDPFMWVPSCLHHRWQLQNPKGHMRNMLTWISWNITLLSTIMLRNCCIVFLDFILAAHHFFSSFFFVFVFVNEDNCTCESVLKRSGLFLKVVQRKCIVNADIEERQEIGFWNGKYCDETAWTWKLSVGKLVCWQREKKMVDKRKFQMVDSCRQVL